MVSIFMGFTTKGAGIGILLSSVELFVLEPTVVVQ